MTAAEIRVVLVDDQELIRTGFALILSTADGIEVIGEASDGAEAIALVDDLVATERAPDVVLMDVRMPGIDGIEATRRIVAAHPGIRVLVLTTFDLDEYAVEAVEAGAAGFLLKDARAAELIGAVRAVSGGDAAMSASVTRRLLGRLREGAPRAAVDADRLAVLTERERDVFDLIARGLSNAEIGGRLHLSESTVKTHVGRVLAKLDLRDRVHAVILAYETGSITSR